MSDDVEERNSVTFVLILLTLAAGFFIFSFLKRKFIYGNSGIIAYQNTNLKYLPIIAAIFIFYLISEFAYSSLFQNKNKKKQNIKFFIQLILTITISVTCVAFPFFRRNELDFEKIYVYNVLNQCKEEYEIKDSDKIAVGISQNLKPLRKHREYEYKLYIRFEYENCSFTFENFRSYEFFRRLYKNCKKNNDIAIENKIFCKDFIKKNKSKLDFNQWNMLEDLFNK